ncbi:MAG TPA: PH domain-containing protein [Gammaproteobacteria bacterium]|nr:PH domain-containing protein [Gammaproteobacteria bacterium]
MATYVESVLSPGEKVEYMAKVSIWAMLPQILIGLATLPLFGLGLLFLIWAALQYISTELAITDRKVIAKFGFIKRESIEMLLPKVESIQVQQSVLGRIFNFGSVVVAGAGAPQAPVPGIANPMEFRRRFMEIQERAMASVS